MRRTTVLFAILVCTAILYSCGRRPGNVLSQEDMAKVLYDMQLAEAMMNNSYDSYYNETEHKDALIKSVLDKYNISQADFDTSLVWYSDNIVQYMTINDSVAARLRGKAEALRKVMSERTMGGNALRDRLLPAFFYLTETTPSLSFNIDSFKIKTMKMDHFKVGFNVQGLSDVQQVKAGFYFTYKDTAIQKFVDVKENAYYLIDKPQMPDSLLKSVSGYIRMKGTAIPSRVILYDIVYEDSISGSNVATNMPSPQGIGNNRESRRAPVRVDEKALNPKPTEAK